MWKEVGRPQRHECNLNYIESLNNNKTISGSNTIVTMYFETPPSTMSLLSTTYSINNQNNNKDEVISNDVNKDKSQRSHMPSLEFNDKDCINSDVSPTNIFSTSSSDKVIALPLQKNT